VAVACLLGIGFVAARITLALSASSGADAFVLDGNTEDDPDWLFVLQEEVPALRAYGWELEVATDFSIRLVEAQDPLRVRPERGAC
jgi:hypothetical protein